jgi:hypothetical protein
MEDNMKLTLRAASLVAAVLVVGALLAPAVSAQKGAGGLLAPGTYRFDFASADFQAFQDNISIFISASSGSDVARPDGAPSTSTSGTQVFLSIFDNNNVTFTFACLTLDNPSDFTIDKRLGSATLHTTLTPSTPTCPGTPPLTQTISIDASWTGVGPLAHSTGASEYTCSSYTAQSSSRSLTNTASAQLALTMNGATKNLASDLTGLNSNTFDVQAHGTVDPLCGPTGFGVGPTPAGHYHFFGLFANGFFGMPPGPTDQVSLFENNLSSQTGGGPSTTASEFDLNVSLFDGFGCFAIPTSDVVSSGLVSATVQTTVTTSTTLCANSFPGFGLNFPMSVSATWTGVGPVMSVHDQNNYQCLGYTQAASTFVKSRGVTSTATITMPDFQGNPQTQTLIDGFGSLTQVDQRVQANGVLPQSCLIRA